MTGPDADEPVVPGGLTAPRRGERDTERLRRALDHRPRGARGGAQAAGHVHRLDRGARPAPPGLGDRRQRRRRGAGRLLRHASRSILLADGGVRVQDNGRGIPVDLHPVERRPAVEVVLTTLHAGGKFDGESYAVSGGLHGVGAAVVNALSTRLEVEIRRDGRVWTQSYRRSVPEPARAGRGHRRDRHDRRRSGPTPRSSPRRRRTRARRCTAGCRRWRSSTRACRSRCATSVSSSPAGRSSRRRCSTRAASRTTSATSTPPRSPVHPTVIGFADETTSGMRMSVEVAMQWNDSLLRVGLHLRQHHQHARRAAPTRRASARR